MVSFSAFPSACGEYPIGLRVSEVSFCKRTQPTGASQTTVSRIFCTLGLQSARMDEAIKTFATTSIAAISSLLRGPNMTG